MRCKPWSKQKELQSKPIPVPEELRQIISSISSPRNKALISLAYLTGGRISELVDSAITKRMCVLTEKDNRQLLLIRMPNRKNKNRNNKDIPIPIDGEPLLVKYILVYLGTLELDEPLFQFQRSRAYQIIQKEIGMNCHFLRHLRATHLVVHKDFNEQLLLRFMGWSDSRPAKHYMEIRWKDILQKL